MILYGDPNSRKHVRLQGVTETTLLPRYHYSKVQAHAWEARQRMDLDCFEIGNVSPYRRSSVAETTRPCNARRPRSKLLSCFKLDHCRSRVFRETREKEGFGTLATVNRFQQRKTSLLLVRFLYMIRCPHSLQRMGSRGLISFFAPQSVLRKG